MFRVPSLLFSLLGLYWVCLISCLRWLCCLTSLSFPFCINVKTHANPNRKNNKQPRLSIALYFLLFAIPKKPTKPTFLSYLLCAKIKFSKKCLILAHILFCFFGLNSKSEINNIFFFFVFRLSRSRSFKSNTHYLFRLAVRYYIYLGFISAAVFSIEHKCCMFG